MSFKKTCIFLISFLLILSSFSMTVLATSPSPLGTLIEKVTSEIYTEHKWELDQKDYNSEYIENKTTASTTVEATTSREAIEKAEANVSAGSELIGASASIQGEVGTTSGGQTIYRWKVTGTKITKRIQYYDLYKEYAYHYYKAIVKDVNTGRVVKTIDKGVFKDKVPTGDTKLEKGRFTAP